MNEIISKVSYGNRIFIAWNKLKFMIFFYEIGAFQPKMKLKIIFEVN